MENLPLEIVSQICSYLDPKDVLTLCRVSRKIPIEERLAKEAVRAGCFHHRSRYEQGSTWRNIAYKGHEFEFKCPTFIDTPLPSDFECLCKDSDLDSIFGYTDKGVFLNGKFLNLTGSRLQETPVMETPKIKKISGGYEIRYKDCKEFVPGDYPVVKWTNSCLVAVNTHK